MASPGARNPVPLAITGIVALGLIVLLAFNATTIFSSSTAYTAAFTEAAGLKSGDKVTIAGVEAGRVTSVKLDGDHVKVGFDVTDAWVGDRTSASIQIRTLLGAKYLALDPQGDAAQDPGATIPVSRTASPLDVVEAFNGLSGTIDQLDTKQLATSLSTLSDTFRNTPDDVRGALDGLSRLSTTIASRDDQIRSLLANTRKLSTVLADRSGDVTKLLSDGNLLLGELQRRETAIANLLDGTRTLSQQLSGLVADNKDQLRPTLESLSRVVDILQRNQDNLANTIKNEAVFIRLFTNAVGNGRWFDSYICGLLPVPTLGPLNPGAADMPLTTTDRRQMQFVALGSVLAILIAAGVWILSTAGGGRALTAYFSNASALFPDNEVVVLGVPVGKIDKITPEGTQVRVDMTITDKDLRLPADAKAAVVSPSLVTGRYVQLLGTYKGGPELADGATIPLSRTAVPLGVDDLTRTATQLSQALGPNGLNKTGALSDALKVGAANLDGNGQALNDTIRNLGDLSGTLNGSSDDLFGTVTELEKFTSTLAANDGQVREFNGRLADVSTFLAGQRSQLGDAVKELSTALGDVSAFVKDNRAALKSNVDGLTQVTQTLVDQQRALTEVLDVAPAATSNLINTYNASSGTLDTRPDLNELANPPLVTLCKLLGIPGAGTPGIPQNVVDACTSIGGIVTGAVPLPSTGDVLTALYAGQPPPVAGLALPTVPGVGSTPPTGGTVAQPPSSVAPAPPAGSATAPQLPLLGSLLGGGR